MSLQMTKQLINYNVLANIRNQSKSRNIKGDKIFALHECKKCFMGIYFHGCLYDLNNHSI